MKLIALSFLFTMLVFLIPQRVALGQQYDMIEQSEVETGRGDVNDPNMPDLVTEKVLRISPTKRVLLITNDNQSYFEGDYLTLLTDYKHIVRTLCAKLRDGVCGIKLVKIYNLELWDRLKTGMEVQVLRGDDSYFTQPRQASSTDEGPEKIQNEEDLYNDTTLLIDDDVLIEENKNREIKTDNIIGVNYGLIQGVDNAGESHQYGMFSAHWSYQILDNLWFEALYGETLVAGFPGVNIDTRFRSMIGRVKYTIPAPFYSYIMPYVGYQNISASSPDAGTKDLQINNDPDNELELLELMKKTGPIFGISIYKRLVPGWFLKADLGTDTISAGLSLEF